MNFNPKHPKINPITEDLYAGAEKCLANRNYRTYLGFSQIGNPCLRFLWYHFRGYSTPPIEGRVLSLFQMGNLIEKEICLYLRAAGYEIKDTVLDKQMQYDDFNGYFRGSADGKINYNGEWCCLEMKSMQGGAGSKPGKYVKGFKKITEAVKKEFESPYSNYSYIYYCQVQINMLYAGLKKCMVICYNKDNSEMYSEIIEFSEPFALKIKEKALKIISSNEIPERCFEEESFECKFCNYKEHCWNPERAIQTNPVCGNCKWLEMPRTLKPVCNYHKCDVQKWGRTCKNWEGR